MPLGLGQLFSLRLFIPVLICVSILFNILHIYLRVSVPPHVWKTAGLFLLCLMILWSICYYRSITDASYYVVQVFIGYATNFVLSCIEYQSSAPDPILTVLSFALIVVLVFGVLPAEYRSVSEVSIKMQIFHSFPMWLGFTCGSLLSASYSKTLFFNVLLLVYYVSLIQSSYLCTVWFVFSTVLQLCLLGSFTKNGIETFHGLVALPLGFAYAILFIRFQFYRLFSPLNLLSRWTLLIHSHHFVRLAFLLLIYLVQFLAFIQYIYTLYQNHFAVQLTCFFIILAYVWIMFRFFCCMMMYALNRTFTLCNGMLASHSKQGLTLWHIWSSNGVREFGLFGYHVFLFSPFLTCFLMFVVIFGLSSPHCLLHLCLPIEVCLFSFFRELANVCTGTCAGHAIIMQPSKANALFEVPDAPPPSTSRLLKDFRHHQFPLVHYLRSFFEEFCIYNSQDLNSVLDSPTAPPSTHANADAYAPVQNQLLADIANFFRQRVPNTATRFSTYLLYYCGPATIDGDWLLGDGTTLELQVLVKQWQLVLSEGNVEPTRSRLLLVVDAPGSRAWHRRLLKCRIPSSIGFQSGETFVPKAKLCWFRERHLPRYAEPVGDSVGEFTRLWVQWNISKVRRHAIEPSDAEFVVASSSSPNIRTFYMVTTTWAEVCNSKPQSAEFADFARAQFPSWFASIFQFFYDEREPSLCYRLIKSVPGVGAVSSFLAAAADWIWAVYRPWWFLLFAPREIETQHGFHLTSHLL